jgi:hypothetical protein
MEAGELPGVSLQVCCVTFKLCAPEPLAVPRGCLWSLRCEYQLWIFRQLQGRPQWAVELTLRRGVWLEGGQFGGSFQR